MEGRPGSGTRRGEELRSFRAVYEASFFSGTRSCFLGSFCAAAKQSKGRESSGLLWWTPSPGHLHPHKLLVFFYTRTRVWILLTHFGSSDEDLLLLLLLFSLLLLLLLLLLFSFPLFPFLSSSSVCSLYSSFLPGVFLFHFNQLQKVFRNC